MKMTSKGRISFDLDFLREILRIPSEVRLQNVSYDPAEQLITLISYSEKPVEGFTYPFGESDKQEDTRYYVSKKEETP